MSMTLIQTVTVSGSSTTNIQFASIPSTYTDLLLVLSGRGSQSANFTPLSMFINGNNSNGSWRLLNGDGSAASSSNASGYMDTSSIPAASSTSNTFGNMSLYFSNYAGATNKSISVDGVAENNATNGIQQIRAILWASTSAITQIDLAIASGNYIAGTTASLYGILKGSGGATVS
jgi:hypothetical protein